MYVLSPRAHINLFDRTSASSIRRCTRISFVNAHFISLQQLTGLTTYITPTANWQICVCPTLLSRSRSMRSFSLPVFQLPLRPDPASFLAHGTILPRPDDRIRTRLTRENVLGLRASIRAKPPRRKSRFIIYAHSHAITSRAMISFPFLD